MKKNLLVLAVCITALANTALAHVWRVNNNAAKNPDFSSISAAIAAAADGDTIHIEPSPTAYTGSVIVNKKLVILGNGYFLGAAGLQANQDSSIVNSVVIDSTSVGANGSGSVISGLTILGITSFIHNVRNVILTRCLFFGEILFNAYDKDVDGLRINQSFITGVVTNGAFTGNINVSFENNIFSATTGFSLAPITLDAHVGGLFRNNTVNVHLVLFTLSGFYIANNVFIGQSLTDIQAQDNIVRNNIFESTLVNGITNTNGNMLGVNLTPLFTGDFNNGHGDTRFQTTAGLLRGSGETIGGITPDVGAYNTVAATDSYRSSGIPAVPTVYALTAPTNVLPTATTMNITVSTRSNN